MLRSRNRVLLSKWYSEGRYLLKTRKHSQQLGENAFGNLVRLSRLQLSWSQEQLAEKWGHSREYVSMVERGRRKVEKQEELCRLAEVLSIPSERLEAVGKELPRWHSAAQKPAETNEILLQTLLEPSLAAVKLAWLLWISEGRNTLITENLSAWIKKLEDATSQYRGEFFVPALQVLASAHEMQGNIAFDHLRYTDANGHFQEMLDIGKELKDPDLISLAHIHMADIFRKRGRYETAIGLLNSILPTVKTATSRVQGIRWQIEARAHSAYGKASLFEAAIEQAEQMSRNTKGTLDTFASQFDLVEILQEKAQGWSMLWQPQKALEIYKETDRLRPVRSMRDLGSYTIIKAQAHGYHGDLDTGINLALEGLKLAKWYQSKRHVSRVQAMYNRLHATPLGSHSRMRDLSDALIETTEALRRFD